MNSEVNLLCVTEGPPRTIGFSGLYEYLVVKIYIVSTTADNAFYPLLMY